MTWLERIMILFTVASLSAGQILFKCSAKAIEGKGFFWEGVIGLLTNPLFFSALLVYGVATIGWIWVLRTVELNIAYPFVALSFVLVPVASCFLLNEALNSRIWIGGAFLVVGIVVIQSGKL